MQDVTFLSEQLSDSYLAFLREKEDFFEFECDSYRLGFEKAIAYDTPRLVPAPFDPMVELRCHANRTHARPDDLGRSRPFTR